MAGNGTESTRMLIVSREPSALRSLWAIGEANSWQLETAGSGWEALERVHSGTGPDLVLLDLAQGDADGLHTLRWLRRVRPDVPIILLSYPEDAEQRVQAFRLGAQDYLVRPLQEQELEIVIKRHLSGKNGNGEMEIASDDIERISDDMFFVAASPMMRKLRAQAELLAQVNVPVLILGESGSGKEIAARLIHRLSVRSAFRFLKVNCAALPGDLLESELFGYERGAFTGALRTKPGKFELADKGCILLDEIAEMSPLLQAKLLHVLQDGEYSRLGAKRSMRVDARVLASTNKCLEEAVAKGGFREDLYFRLNVIKIEIPPLRERREDIPLLCTHFFQMYRDKYKNQTAQLPRELLEAFIRYDWPGNVRQLENAIKRYLILSDLEMAFAELKNSRSQVKPIIPQESL